MTDKAPRLHEMLTGQPADPPPLALAGQEAKAVQGQPSGDTKLPEKAVSQQPTSTQDSLVRGVTPMAETEEPDVAVTPSAAPTTKQTRRPQHQTKPPNPADPEDLPDRRARVGASAKRVTRSYSMRMEYIEELDLLAWAKSMPSTSELLERIVAAHLAEHRDLINQARDTRARLGRAG